MTCLPTMLYKGNVYQQMAALTFTINSMWSLAFSPEFASDQIRYNKNKFHAENAL
jgi:hypothetical protein